MTGRLGAMATCRMQSTQSERSNIVAETTGCFEVQPIMCLSPPNLQKHTGWLSILTLVAFVCINIASFIQQVPTTVLDV